MFKGRRELALLSLPSNFPLNGHVFHMGGKVQGEDWVRAPPPLGSHELLKDLFVSVCAGV